MSTTEKRLDKDNIKLAAQGSWPELLAGIRSNGNGTSIDIMAAVARAKSISVDSLRTYGAEPSSRDGKPVVQVPVYNEQGESHSHFDIGTSGQLAKGMFPKGKGSAGMFFPNRLPQAGETWIVSEGVKDAAAYHGLGFNAAGTPTDQMATKYARLFADCDVIVMPDRTVDAELKALATAARLFGVAATVRVGTLPLSIDGKEGDDTRDVLKKRDGEGMLKQAIEDATEWRPESNPDNMAIISNVEKTGDGGFPKSMTRILDDINTHTDGWPRRIDTALFVDDDHHGIAWLNKPAQLFGWLHRRVGGVVWSDKGDGLVKQAEVFSEIQRTAQKYVAVEQLPHEPMIDGHYYACDDHNAGDGKHLQELLDRFSPETDADRDLILSALMTTGWGGPPGVRPVFLITSDDGRGVGKSTLAEMIGSVWNGYLSIAQSEDISKIKTRLLSAEALTRRVAILDNVKSARFSWGELEGLVTATSIGGHRMYVGEAVRPNTLTWFITLNGASLSTDMAQRCVTIKLVKPNRSATWLEDTRRFIDQHRRQIIEDIIGALRADRYQLNKFTRWATWEQDILQRVPDPSEAQKVIAERQGVIDTEAEEASQIEDFFADQLEKLTYDIDTDIVFIPSAVAARWYGWATNEKASVVVACRRLSQMASEGRIQRLGKNKARVRGRGMIWTGSHWDCETPTRTDLEERLSRRNDR
jgi:hypothetical protein